MQPSAEGMHCATGTLLFRSDTQNPEPCILNAAPAAWREHAPPDSACIHAALSKLGMQTQLDKSPHSASWAGMASAPETCVATGAPWNQASVAEPLEPSDSRGAWGGAAL